MQDNIKRLHHVRDGARQSATEPCIATVREVTCDGLVLDMGHGTNVVARMTSEVARVPKKKLVGTEVLVLFEKGDPLRPVAISSMHSGVQHDSDSAVEDGDESPLHAIVDGEQVIVQAQKRIELRCGKGSITITRDGKITVSGTHLLSRSSGPLRIKGGHVDIN